ncbi:TorD/DmsD family molecular chaperone [Shewanella sp. MF05960]|uniref:TorD/DmsD family molecular chaperone n=1 Tax=Shewanella sp. MF05960 TaxID=3434874 RepID=UPI003D7966D4
MHNNQRELSVAALNILHHLFYKRPKSDYFNELSKSGMFLSWPDLGEPLALQDATQKILTSLHQDDIYTLERDYYALFVGPGPVFSYPWGSVYSDRENLICSKTTIAFQIFCDINGIQFDLQQKEPIDHIGLMLAVLSALIVQGNQQGVHELLAEHLMPWAPRMLQLVEEQSKTNLYQGVAILARELLLFLTRTHGVTPKKIPLYF